MLVRVEELTPNLSRVRLFHTSVTRAIASWPTWPGEPGFTGDFAEYLAQKFPTSTAADFAVLEAGVVSEETYVEQGLYWTTGHVPMLEYVVEKYDPDLLLAGMPTTDEFQHQFLGLVSPKLPDGAPNPAYDDVDLNGVKDGRVAAREAFIRTAYQEADEILTRARELMGKDPTTSSPPTTASRRSSSRSTRASRSSTWACSRGRRRRTAARPRARRSARPRPAGPAARSRSTSTSPAATRPAAASSRSPADQVDATVAAIKAKYLGLVDPNDWTHDGQPEGWKMIDRAFTKAEARYIPNGPGTTADMAHPTRTGDLVVVLVPAVPVRRGDARARSSPRRTSSGSTATCRTSRTSTANINMRATFLAGGEGIAQVAGGREDDRPGADARVPARHPRAAAQPGQRPARVVKGGNAYRPLSIIGLNDFHGQLDPTTLPFDGINVDRRRRRVPRDDVRRGDFAGFGQAGGACSSRRATTSVRRRRTRRCWRTCRRSTSRTPGVSTRPRTATTSSTTASQRLLRHQARANFPFLATNIVEAATGQAPPWVTPSVVFTVNGVKVGVIGAELESTPELVSAGATAGLKFLDEAPRIKAESERLRAARRPGADRRHPRGHVTWPEPDRQRARDRRGKARSWASPTRSRTRRWTR